MIKAVLVCGLLLFHSLAVAQDNEVPDPGKPIIIYLHGQIIEDEGPTPTHPRWGLYDYPAVVEALGDGARRLEWENRLTVFLRPLEFGEFARPRLQRF